MALIIKTFAKVVTTAGTAVPLSTTKLYTTAFLVQANAANTGLIYVGDSTVAASNAPYLVAGASNSKEGQTVTRGMIQTFDLSKVYIDASVNGEGVKVEYIGEE
jgi:hypothetical protein